MDQKLKDRWVKALRSGKYKQVKESLRAEVYDEETGHYRDEIGYCCLGVLCEVAPGISWNGDKYEITQKKLKKLFIDEADDLVDWSLTDLGGYSPEEAKAILRDHFDDQLVINGEEFPKIIEKLWGLDKKVKKDKESVTVQSKLIHMNDNGKSFNEIADYIEKVL